MAAYINSFNILSSTYSVFDARLNPENNDGTGAIVAAQDIYISAKASTNKVVVAGNVFSGNSIGLVPSAIGTASTYFLKGDGTWAENLTATISGTKLIFQ